MQEGLTGIAPARLLALLAVLLTAPAARGGGPIQVVLDARPQELPRFVCVLHTERAKGAKSTGELATAAVSLLDGEARFAEVTGDLLTREGKKAKVSRELQRALDALAGRTSGDAAAPREGTPAITNEYCDARVRRTRQAADAVFVTCGEASHDVSDAPRVLVLELTGPDARDIAPQRIEVDGALVTIVAEVRRADFGLTAYVAGGHYVPRDVQAGFQRRIHLAVESRCLLRDLVLPPAAGLGEDARLVLELGAQANAPREGGPRGRVYSDGWAGAVRVWLPRHTGGLRKELVGTISVGGRDVAVVETKWLEETPPPELPFRVRWTLLEWRRPCELARDVGCPAVVVAEAGTECTPLLPPDPNRSHGCFYTCSAPSGGTFAVPAPLRFRLGGKRGAWEDTLFTLNGALSGYVSPDRRKFSLRVSTGAASPAADPAAAPTDVAPPFAERARRVGDGVRYVHLTLPTRRTEVARLDAAHSDVLLPEATCEDVVRYRYEGDWPYVERTAEIREGVLDLRPPEESARAGVVGASLAPGVAYGIGSEEPAMAGTLDLLVRWRLDVEAKARAAFVDVRLGWTLSDWTYRSLSVTSTTERKRVTRNRFFVSAGVWEAVSDVIELGAELGFGLATPLFFRRDQRFVGRWDWFGLTGLAMRYRPAPWFALEPRLLLLYLDDEYRHELRSPHLDGEPRRTSRESFTLAFEVAGRFWF